MQKRQILAYLHHPGKMDRESLEKLRQIREQYPYFTTVRLLLIRNLFILNDAEYQREIEISAPFVADRRVLYELIHPLTVSDTEAPEEEDKIPDEVNLQNEPEQEINSGAVEPVSETEAIQEEESLLQTSDAPAEESASIMEEPLLLINDTPPVGASEETTGKIPEAQEEPPAPEKRDLRQNISNLLSWQLHELELVDPLQEVLMPETGLDIEKTYGRAPDPVEMAIISDDLLTLDQETEDDNLHTFSDWLSIVDQPDEKQEAEKEVKSVADEKLLIDEFIKTSPRLSAPRENVPHIDISEDSVKEHDGIFTDTLARIYIKQGYYSKAIFAYEKLILKYPEKSGYFAGQIEEIKKLTNKR